MAKKTIRASDKSGAEIPEGKGATVRITFADARKGVRELDLTDAEAKQLGGRASLGAADAQRARDRVSNRRTKKAGRARALTRLESLRSR
jgi:hypothetical protein